MNRVALSGLSPLRRFSSLATLQAFARPRFFPPCASSPIKEKKNQIVALVS